MMFKQTLIATAIILAPMTAMAGGSVDVFYVDNEADVNALGINNDDGNGFGFRGLAELGNGFSATGLYQNTDIDVTGATVDITETRVGLAYTRKMSDQCSVTANLETAQIDLTVSGNAQESVDGYSAGLRGDMHVIDNLSVYAKVAYTDLGSVGGDDVKGPEYEAGMLYSINKNLGAFVEYRVLDLKIDNNGDATLNTLRIGGRYTF